MNETPAATEHQPPAATGRIWTSILLPPILTLATNVIGTACCPSQSGDEMVFLIVAPSVAILAIIAFSIMFLKAVSPRCSGPATGFFYIAYLLGEFGICLALWFASCATLA